MKKTFLLSNRRVGYLTLFVTLFASLAQAQQYPNQLSNAGFEDWNNDCPVFWLGVSSNIDSSSVLPCEEAHTGRYACRLLRKQKTHVRFSSDTMSLEAGQYKLSYYAKGNGCIRNSYSYLNNNGNFSVASYSQYDTLRNSDWLKIEYVFELKKDYDALQLVFSLCQTDENGLIIDDLLLEKVTTSLAEAPRLSEMTCWSKGKQLQVEVSSATRLIVYNLLGEKVVQRNLSIGQHAFDLPSGTYLIKSSEGITRKVFIP